MFAQILKQIIPDFVAFRKRCREHNILFAYDNLDKEGLAFLVIIGPLEDSAGNIISQGFLMAEDLNGYFSSVFTKEDISSLPVADAKFQGAKSDYLGPLVVTPELVAKKIKAMKDNKSPGVDGIPPKLLMETVEQISIPLARVFNLSLKEGVVPFEWKEANIIPLFKKGSRNKS